MIVWTIRGNIITTVVCCVVLECFLNYDQFVCDTVSYFVLCVTWLFFGCLYQCSQLPGKSHLPNDLLHVECVVDWL